MRRVALLVAACTHAPAAPLANQVATAPTWSDRARELCAALGGDPERGLAALALRDVTFGAETEGFGASNGSTGQSWNVVSPRTWLRVGITAARDQVPGRTGLRPVGPSQIVGVWIEVDTAPAALCAALGFELGGPHGVECMAARPELRQLVQVEAAVDHPAHSRLGCHQTKK